MVLWAVGVSMGFPLGMSAAAESGPDPAARISVVASIGYFANLAGPPAIGALAQSGGLLNALWLIAGLFVAAFAVAGALGPRPTVTGPAVTGPAVGGPTGTGPTGTGPTGTGPAVASYQDSPGLP